MATKGRAKASTKAKKPAKKAKQSRAPTTESTEESGQPALDVLVSINQAAHVFARDRATITKRIANFGIAPKTKRGGHPVYSARELNEKLNQFEDDGTRNPDKMTPPDRLSHYKAEAEKNKVNLERGALSRREDVEAEWARVVKIVALELDTIVDQVERDIGAAPLVLTRIEQQIDKVRERIFQKVIADEEDHNELTPASTQTSLIANVTSTTKPA